MAKKCSNSQNSAQKVLNVVDSYLEAFGKNVNFYWSN